MAISKKMATALNNQVKNEFFSYWTYLAMAYSLDTMGYKIFSKWFHAQADEEQAHALKMAAYIADQGAEVKLQELEPPKSNYKTVQQVVEEALKHEIFITDCINKLVDIALKESDHATNSFLQWFVAEQVEEVATANELLDLVKMSTESGQLLMIEDRIMALRGGGGEASA